MAQNGKILEKDIIDKGSYVIGEKLAKSLKPAIDEVESLKKDWIAALTEMKQAAIDLQVVQGKFKAADGMKDFIAAKKLQTEAAEKYAKATKEEAAAVLLLQRAETEKIRTQKESVALEEKEISLSNKKEAVVKRKTQLTALERYEIQRLNQQAREAAILSSKLSTEYEKQSVRLLQLRARYKDVALTLGENSREARKLRKEASELDATLKRVDGHVGQFNRSVGNYGLAMKSAAGAAREMMSALGWVGGIALFVGVMGDAIRRIKEFDKEMYNLSGVLRTTRKDLKGLEESIIDVAGATPATSTEVAQLAVELAQLGKSAPEIQKLLEPTVKLGIGLRTTSEEAGAFLVQMLNVFGASADEAEEYADTLAGISISTTLDFEKMRDGFQYLAPISKILNKDLAYTGAILGILTDNGLKAENAARVLATGQQRLSKSGMSLNDALLKLNEAKAKGTNETDLLKLAYSLMGAEAAKTAIILADNYDKIEANSQAMREQQGVLDDLVKEQMESLEVKLKILDSAWEELILTIESGDGPIGRFFKSAIDGATKLIQSITDVEKAESDLNEVTKMSQDERLQYFRENQTWVEKMVGWRHFAIKQENELLTIQDSLNHTFKEMTNFSFDELTYSLKIYQNQVKTALADNTAFGKMQAALYQNQVDRITQLMAGTAMEEVNSIINAQIELSKLSRKTTEAATVATKADEKAKREQEKAARDAAKAEEELNKALEARIRLIQKTTYENKKAKLESQIDSQNDVSEDESQPVSVRLSANQNSYELSVKKAEEARDRKKQIAAQEYADKQVSDLKLVQTEAQRCEVIEQLNEAHFQELEKIETEFNDEIRQAEENRSKTSIQIVKDEFEKRLAEIKAAQEAEKNLRNEELGAAQSTFKSSAQTPEDVENYRNAVEQINNKYDLKEIQAAKDKAQYILDNYVLSEESRLELQKFVSDKSIELSNEVTEQLLKNADEQKEEYEKLLQQFIQLKQNIIGFMSEGLAESLGADQRDIQDFFSNIADFAADIFTDLDTIPDDFAGKMQAVLGTLSAAAGVTRDIMAGIFAANIDDLERQREASKEFYNNEIEAAEGNEALQTQLREKQKKEDEEYQKRIKKEKTDAAKADKAAAIIQAQINTALAITAALNTQPFLPLGPIMAILAGAMGTAQTIAIAAKPIPKFKTGVENFGGGLAVLGDGGVSEIVRTPDGRLHKTPNKDTLYNLPKGTTVYKSEDEYRKLMRASILTSIEINANNAKKFNAESSFEKNYGKVNEKAIENAISNGFKNQKVNFHTTNHNHAKVDLNYTYWAMKQLKRE